MTCALGASSMTGIANSDLFRGILESLHMAVYVAGCDGKILFWNDGAERITGYLRQEMIGRDCVENFLGETDGGEEIESTPDQVEPPIAFALRDGKSVHTQISLRHKSGHRVPVHMWAFPVRNAAGVVVAAAETFEETVPVAEWDRRHNKLATYGCIDQGSGVLNHGMMQAHVRENLGMFAEHPVPFSVLCIQIDSLEKIQLRDGPAAIASVLRVVAQTLESSLRPTDYLGRWQENQFLAILAECNGSEIAKAAERLRRMVSASKIAWWGDRLPVTISLGGTAVAYGDTVEILVGRADRALRESLSHGGNRVTVSNK
jgi:diguanylate cyclase (GGDEF)-like protein/PAS domain S-box-containing protein